MQTHIMSISLYKNITHLFAAQFNTYALIFALWLINHNKNILAWKIITLWHGHSIN
jgi:hypothetical protein